MIDRRTLTKAGIASVLALQGSRRLTSAQDPEVALEYQGLLAFQNLPELPTAPAGECAIVMQASGGEKSAIVLYHNATEEVMAVNLVTATSDEDFEPGESNHGPHILQPGEYGIAAPTFAWRLDDDAVVTVEITVVPEAEVDPALVTLPITEVAFSKDGEMQEVRVKVQNRSEVTVGEGAGALGVFFTPEGEILDWFSSNTMGEIEAGDDNQFSQNSNTLLVSDSFMIVGAGRALG